MQNIPTKYKNIQFRSRLEATWASFFDKLHWKWEYEPFDLNGWIPDFVIKGKKNQILVEIKPIDQFDLETAKKIYRASLEYKKTGKEFEILLLGYCLLEEIPGVYAYEIALGWIYDSANEWDMKSEWNNTEFTIWERSTSSTQIRHKYKIGFADSYANYTCRITDEHTKGGHFLSFYKSESHDDYEEILGFIQRSWAISKNRTQWKKVN